MKKIFSISLFAACVIGWGALAAQCSINMSNTTPGFTPDPAPAITQGVAYSQTVQVYVPSTYSGATIDSIHITSIGGVPTGITYVFNPESGNGGGTVNGNGNGAICFSGTTSATAGAYPLTFNGSAYTSFGTLPLSQPPLSTAFTYSFTVQAAQAISVCDTIFNLQSILDTPEIYIAGSDVNAGYVSGNNEYGDIAKAEGFASPIGDAVTSAELFFGVATVNAADSNKTITVMVWDNTGTGGAPGNAIDSAHVTLGQIAQAVTASYNVGFTPVSVNFTGNVALTGGTFYVGVVLPTITGDTVALFTNSVPGGSDGNGWELGLNQAGTAYVWGTYNTDWGFTGGSAGNYIVSGVCGNAPLAFFQVNALSGCAPFTVNFTDESVNAPTTYGWVFGDGGTSTSASPSHSYAAAGSYNVVESVSSAGGSSTKATTITVIASPTATSSVAASSASVVASGGTSPYTYVWSNGATTASISGVALGTYSVVISDANGCTDTVSGIDVITSGILQLSSGQQVKIYPNPATNVLNLVWSQQSNAEVSIVDLNGNVISTITTNGDMKTLYDIHNLAAGSYIVRITDKTNNQQKSMLFSKF